MTILFIERERQTTSAITYHLSPKTSAEKSCWWECKMAQLLESPFGDIYQNYKCSYPLAQKFHFWNLSHRWVPVCPQNSKRLDTVQTLNQLWCSGSGMLYSYSGKNGSSSCTVKGRQCAWHTVLCVRKGWGQVFLFAYICIKWYNGNG